MLIQTFGLPPLFLFIEIYADERAALTKHPVLGNYARKDVSSTFANV
jgi:hypothetical protein